MQDYIAFAARHWELCSAFIVVLGLILGLELRNKLTGLTQLSPQAAVTLLNREQAVILDTRDKSQFIEGHILGAIHIPANELEQKIALLKAHNAKTIILLPAAGQSPSKSAAILKNNGYLSVQSLAGGLAAWTAANLPLVKGAS